MKKITIGVIALTLAVFLAVPAIAANITPYASMRLGIYWESHDFKDYNPTWTTEDDDCGLMIDIADIARFGAKGQVGDIYGVAELGLVGQENNTGYTWAAYNGDNNEVYTRLLYGQWKFGGGTLTVGQDYSPVTYPSFQQGPGIFDDIRNTSYDLQNGNVGTGCLWDSRIPQIRVNLDNGLYFMVAQVDDIASGGTGPPGATAGGDTDVILPKTIIGYEYKAEGLYLNPGVAYNSYNYDDGVAGGFDDDITAWILYLHGKLDLGNVALKFTGHYGQNLGDYAISGRSNPYDATINVSKAYVNGTSVDDATCFGGYVQAAIPVDPYTVHLGWAYTSSKNDTTAVSGYDEADELMAYFVNLKIPVTDNFFACPEFDYYDGMKNANDATDPDHWYLGVTWQMDF